MTSPAIPLEHSGWSRIDNSASALEQVRNLLVSYGVPVEPFDLRPWATAFRLYRNLPEYEGPYKTYGGAMEYCLLEKALEHYISILLAEPRPGMTAVDIGSCKSVVPAILRRTFSIRCLEQDLAYPPGLHGDQVGSSADEIPLPDASVDFMTLHCTYEHFEGAADTGFVRESARLLRPGGRTVILPLYLNRNHCNVTGETDPTIISQIGWDGEASYRCAIPEWQNRFGRHYSATAFLRRVYEPAAGLGLKVRLLQVQNWELIHPKLWLRWVLVLER